MLIYILYYSHLKLSAASKMQWDTLQISTLNISKCIYKYLRCLITLPRTQSTQSVRLEGNVVQCRTIYRTNCFDCSVAVVCVPHCSGLTYVQQLFHLRCVARSQPRPARCSCPK